jgi:hypothetical protein
MRFSTRLVWGLATALAGGVALFGAAGVPPAPAGVLLPDLDQGAPYRLVVTSAGGQTRLAFGSLVKNIGGEMLVHGNRASTGTGMTAYQTLNGVTHGPVGTLHYQATPPGVKGHNHWHFTGFMVYELRRVGRRGALVARDQKQGFCLGDLSLRNCMHDRPEVLDVILGLGRNAEDTYSPDVEGQFIDISRVSAGTYVLKHTSNPQRTIKEARYTNNSASARVRITRARGKVRAAITKVCPRTPSC